jgi:hypothetical protein
MIKTLSTYNLTVPFVSPLTSATCTEYTVNIYIWSGESSAVPAETEYTITKENHASSTGNDKIQIGRLVNDFIEFLPDNSDTMEELDTSQWWVKTEVIYTTANPTDDDVKQSPETLLALKGYGYGNEGENPQPRADGILVENDLFRVSRNSRTTIGLLLDDSKVGTVISYPANEIDYSFSILAQTDSNEIVKLLNIPSPENDTYIEVKIGARTITLIIKDEFKYSPVDVYFLNKDGVQQTLTFFKERQDSLSVTRENYESIAGQPADGYHQFPDFNVNGRTKVTLTSGYVPEVQNSTFKQLMLSTKVYIYNGEFIPVNVVGTTIQYQTRLNERLISYDIEFEYSFSEINNI